MIVAFRGMGEDELSISSNMIASAFAMTLQRRVQVILMESCPGSFRLEQALSNRTEVMVREPYAYMSGVGMDYLLKRSRNGMLGAASAKDGVTYVTEQIGYIPGVLRSSRPAYEAEFGQECPNILKQLNQTADYVFINCSQVQSTVQERVMEAADLIVVNVEQSEEILDEYFSFRSPFEHKTVYCIGNYIKEEPCNLKNIQRMYRLDGRSIGTIPYNVEFLSALHRGKARSFFDGPMIKNRYYKNREFFQAVYKMAEEIMRWEEEHLGEEKAKPVSASSKTAGTKK